jgi:hypothetical protein
MTIRTPVQEADIDYDEIFRRGGQNLGDEDFALLKCPQCSLIYLVEYEVDTIYTDPWQLSARVGVTVGAFTCIKCRNRFPNEAWIGPRAAAGFVVTWDDLYGTPWAWVTKAMVSRAYWYGVVPDGSDASSSPSIPKYAARVRAAREKALLAPQDLAGPMGISYDSYLDLECYDDELKMCVSLAGIATFCTLTGTEPARLLCDHRSTMPGPDLPAEVLLDRLRDYLCLAGASLLMVEERVGWTLGTLQSGVTSLRAWNLDELIDISSFLGTDWRRVVPSLADPIFRAPPTQI